VRNERSTASRERHDTRGTEPTACGLEDATPETVEYLAAQFEPPQKMRGLLETYGKTINQITENVGADEEDRIQAYAELR
jgi:hypothetical protein